MHISLVPFTPEDSCKIVSQVDLNENHNVKLHFEVTDFKSSQDIRPNHKILPAKDKLYVTTCFELFVGRGSSYIEWNISTQGHWFGYAFSAYRKLTDYDLEDFAPVKISQQITKTTVSLDVEWPWLAITKYLPATDALAVKPCVILESDGVLQYWAPRHAGQKPDFHDPSTFKNIITY